MYEKEIQKEASFFYNIFMEISMDLRTSKSTKKSVC